MTQRHPARPRAASSGTAAPGRDVSPPTLQAPPPLYRDAWAIACVGAVVFLLARAWNVALGVPVAEDFDFLQRSLFHPFTLTGLLDGGGSTSFWRPIPHQIYYAALGPVMLSHPIVVAGIHTVLLTLATLALYRAFRIARPGVWAAAVAMAPVLSESTRTLIAWPSDFVDLGLWTFTALAVHETAMRRLPTALAALLGALLCKEVAVVAAGLLPFLPMVGPRGREERLRWGLAFGGLTGLWAAVYLAVRSHAQLELPHQMEASLMTAQWPARIAWAIGNSLRALVSLPLATSSRDGAVAVMLALLALGWGVFAYLRARSRARPRSWLPYVLWGGAWFLAASATLTAVYPYWMPNRTAFASLGFAVASAEIALLAHPAVLVGLIAVRGIALLLAPGAPPGIASIAPETGAFMDFEHHTRLQRLMRETRAALQARMPTAPPGTRVAMHYMPRHAEYAFGGHHALRAWYGDSTLDWISPGRMRNHPDSALAAIVEFEAETFPQIAIVEPDAMRAYLASLERLRQSQWTAAEILLVRAQALQKDDAARVFRGLLAGERARVLLATGRIDDADRQANLAIHLFRKNVTSHQVLAYTALLRGQILQAAAHVDSALQWVPDDVGTLALRDQVLRAARGAQSAR